MGTNFDSKGWIWGPDVSVMQGEVPWKDLADYGASFGIARMQVGNDYKDSAYKRNVTSMIENNIVPGGYTFLYPLPHLDPVEEAKRAFQADDLAQTNEFGDRVHGTRMPPMIDFEWPLPVVGDTVERGSLHPSIRHLAMSHPTEAQRILRRHSSMSRTAATSQGWRKWGCSPNQLCEWALKHAETTQQLYGQKPIIYWFKWFTQVIGAARYPEFAKYYQAMADYPTMGAFPAPGRNPYIAPPFDTWSLWQFDGDNGLTLPNGRDADFNVFNGNRDQFLEFVGAPVAGSETVPGNGGAP